jgi:hypothetical protein
VLRTPSPTRTVLRRLLLATTATVVVGLTSGCLSQAAEDPVYSDLVGEPTTQKATPAGLPDDIFDNFDRDTLRWVGEHEGSEVWLAAGNGDFAVCLLIYPNELDWVSGCGGGGPSVSGPDGRRFSVVADGAPAPSNSVAISENVYTTD